jgi:hypothetical protein
MLIAASLCWFVPFSSPALAHHSFSMFDGKKEVWMEGTVTELQWSNPHSFLAVDVPTKGSVIHYFLEAASPSLPKSAGWKRTALKPGDKIRFSIYPWRSGQPGGALVEVIRADGSKLDAMTRGLVK